MLYQDACQAFRSQHYCEAGNERNEAIKNISYSAKNYIFLFLFKLYQLFFLSKFRIYTVLYQIHFYLWSDTDRKFK